ncbi:hypothetical protein [Candidatus Uabimicrobium sp. HlEnr_7]|uniref:hypothetical protein n=1 Tax=Candidatus Uabimicrobium helgolandensis TaxID=3095367 RepID=UPI003557D4E1
MKKKNLTLTLDEKSNQRLEELKEVLERDSLAGTIKACLTLVHNLKKYTYNGTLTIIDENGNKQPVTFFLNM